MAEAEAETATETETETETETSGMFESGGLMLGTGMAPYQCL